MVSQVSRWCAGGTWNWNSYCGGGVGRLRTSLRRGEVGRLQQNNHLTAPAQGWEKVGREIRSQKINRKSLLSSCCRGDAEARMGAGGVSGPEDPKHKRRQRCDGDTPY
jgi:hypothetical protein